MSFVSQTYFSHGSTVEFQISPIDLFVSWPEIVAGHFASEIIYNFFKKINKILFLLNLFKEPSSIFCSAVSLGWLKRIFAAQDKINIINYNEFLISN